MPFKEFTITITDVVHVSGVDVVPRRAWSTAYTFDDFRKDSAAASAAEIWCSKAIKKKIGFREHAAFDVYCRVEDDDGRITNYLVPFSMGSRRIRKPVRLES